MKTKKELYSHNFCVEIKMTSEQLRLVKERISEIMEYREVLSRLYKYQISLNQAIADWFEKGFHEKLSKSGNP